VARANARTSHFRKKSVQPCVILNFKRPRLELERVVLTPADKLNLRGDSPQMDADGAPQEAE